MQPFVGFFKLCLIFVYVTESRSVKRQSMNEISKGPKTVLRSTKEVVKYGSTCNYTLYNNCFNRFTARRDANASFQFLDFLSGPDGYFLEEATLFIDNSSAVTTNSSNFTNTKEPIPTEKVYFLDKLEELCVHVDENLVVDIFKYDCLGRNGRVIDEGESFQEIQGALKDTCYCGHKMDNIDPNIPPIKKQGQVIEYFQTVELDRKLVLDAELNECVSGLKGHCSNNKTLPFPLMCASKLHCSKHATDTGTRFKNKNTGVVYGLCARSAGIRTESVQPPSKTNRGGKLSFNAINFLFVLWNPKFGISKLSIFSIK